MSLNVARTKLVRSLRELHLRWDGLEGEWDDRVRKQLEERYLDPLEGLTLSTVAAIENVSKVLHRAKGECE